MRMRAIPQKPVTPATISPAPTNAGTPKNQGETNRAQHRSEERKAAGADLNLPLQLDRLTAVGHDGEPCLLPGIETTFDDEGFAGATYFLGEPRGVAHRSRATLAMKDDGLAFVQREVGLVELGERQMARPGDLLPGMLIRLADVDQDRALMQEPLGFGRANFWK